MCNRNGIYAVDCIECWEREMKAIGKIELLLERIENNERIFKSA